MTKWKSPGIDGAPIPGGKFSQNGSTPSSVAANRISGIFNQIAERRRKMVMMAAQDVQQREDPGGAWTGLHIPFHAVMRTGENVDKVRAVICQAPPGSSSSAFPSANPANAKLELYDGTNTLTSPLLYHPKDSGGGLFKPSDYFWGMTDITVDDSPALQSNTVYRVRIVGTNFARITSATVYEIGAVPDSATTGCCDPAYWQEGKPIYDAGAQDLLETGTKLWQHNASHLLTWSGRTNQSTGRTTVSSATWTNLCDGSTSVTANTAGYRIHNQYHDSHKSNAGTPSGHGVPVEVGVYAELLSGSANLEVRFQSTSGTLASWTSISSANPYSGTATIAAQNGTKVDVQARTTAGTSWAIYAISLWEYEA